MRRRLLTLILVLAWTVTACTRSGGERAVPGPAPTPPTTVPTTTTVVRLNEQVVDSGTSPAGAWQLMAYAEPKGVACAGVRVERRDAGPRVCNQPTEQDASGDNTLRYGAGESFVVAVTLPAVRKVQAQLRDGTMVERATVVAPFSSTARFAALYLPPGAVIRSLVALDAAGRRLTSITINP
jgi:hypothetical protein